MMTPTTKCLGLSETIALVHIQLGMPGVLNRGSTGALGYAGPCLRGVSDPLGSRGHQVGTGGIKGRGHERPILSTELPGVVEAGQLDGERRC